MFYFGNRNEELLEKNINGLSCHHCNTETNQRLVIYCRALTFGIFYPLKWWSFDKKGFLNCKKCGNKSYFDHVTIQNQEPKIRNYFNDTQLPLRHRIPSFLLFGSIFMSIFLFFFLFAKSFYTIFQSPNNVLPGVWKEEYGRYKMYIHDDQSYTIINNDTIAYGNYDIDNFNVTFDFLGRATTFPKLAIKPMRLYDYQNIDYDFERINDNLYGDLYAQKNNRWRISPKNPQNANQIKNSILNYLRFEIKKYEIALEEEIQYIDIDPNSPLTFGLNGIATSIENQKQWKSLFYNDDNWNTANIILEEEFPYDFKIRSYKDDYFQRNLDFLKELEGNINQSKLEYVSK